ncbi:hypothetical protein NA56DRAFT_645987 [Hyaloscypha hepaticicola]|uniref:Uncharacterized protein n=1 Tax=Hyaloscypha hepaticicola TaxID=2082293 RepID=A0A2J6Q3M1_9HELO|nr:hypothetical protein NA56DRAFT_645987 [Hyaloscypha hepaticicola]
MPDARLSSGLRPRCLEKFPMHEQAWEQQFLNIKVMYSVPFAGKFSVKCTIDWSSQRIQTSIRKAILLLTLLALTSRTAVIGFCQFFALQSIHPCT